MAAWGYEFYLRVLKVSLTSDEISEEPAAPEQKALLLSANYVSNHGDTNILTREG